MNFDFRVFHSCLLIVFDMDRFEIDRFVSMICTIILSLLYLYGGNSVCIFFSEETYKYVTMYILVYICISLHDDASTLAQVTNGGI